MVWGCGGGFGGDPYDYLNEQNRQYVIQIHDGVMWD